MPAHEDELLLTGGGDRVFDAYVNIKSLEGHIATLRKHYPNAKFIITTNNGEPKDESTLEFVDDLDGADFALLYCGAPNKWQIVCEHLRCVPPACAFPIFADQGQRQIVCETIRENSDLRCKIAKRDKSPWIIESRKWWRGIHCSSIEGSATTAIPVKVSDCLKSLDTRRWFPRDDTFTDNLGLFRPANIAFLSGSGVALNVQKESLPPSPRRSSQQQMSKAAGD